MQASCFQGRDFPGGPPCGATTRIAVSPFILRIGSGAELTEKRMVTVITLAPVEPSGGLGQRTQRSPQVKLAEAEELVQDGPRSVLVVEQTAMGKLVWLGIRQVDPVDTANGIVT